MNLQYLQSLMRRAAATQSGVPTGPTPPPSAGPTPSPSAGPGMLAPWWTGTTDQFFGQSEGLGAAPTEWDIRKVLDRMHQGYSNGEGGLGGMGNWGGGFPGNGGGGWVPPQPGGGQPVDDPNASADTGMLSRSSGFGAAYRRYRDSKNQD